MVLNATFKNISVISCRSILLVVETGVLRENHRPVTCHWQTLSHNVASITLRYERDSNGTHSFSAHNGILLLIVALYCAPEDSLSFLRRRMCYPVPWLCPCSVLPYVSIKYHLNILHASHDSIHLVSSPTSYDLLFLYLFFRFEFHWCGVVNFFFGDFW